MTCNIRACEVEFVGYNFAGGMVFGSSEEVFIYSLTSNQLVDLDSWISTMYFRNTSLLQNSHSHLHAAAYTLKSPSTTCTQTPDSPYP
jgi:hypothetical protein